MGGASAIRTGSLVEVEVEVEVLKWAARFGTLAVVMPGTTSNTATLTAAAAVDRRSRPAVTLNGVSVEIVAVASRIAKIASGVGLSTDRGQEPD